MLLLAQAGGEDVDVGVVLVLVDLVEDAHAGAQAVLALGAVGAPLHDGAGLPPRDLYLGPVEMPLQLRRVLWRFQGFDHVQQGPHGLLLVVGADVYVIPPDAVVGGQQRHALQSDAPVLPRAPAQHDQRVWPPGHPVRPEGTQMEGEQERLPGKHCLEGEIPGQPQVFLQLFPIGAKMLRLEAPAHIGAQQLLVLAGADRSALHLFQVGEDAGVQLTAHRPRPRP